jgi:hypothetical protein
MYYFVVIDFCLVKCLICDPETNYQSLRMQWSSHASATQRKGVFYFIQKMIQSAVYQSLVLTHSRGFDLFYCPPMYKII